MCQPCKKSCAVIHVGSNNFFRKDVQSQDVVEKYMELIGTVHDKFDNIVFVGVLPRLNASQFALSRAIGIDTNYSTTDYTCREANRFDLCLARLHTN